MGAATRVAARYGRFPSLSPAHRIARACVGCLLLRLLSLSAATSAQRDAKTDDATKTKTDDATRLDELLRGCPDKWRTYVETCYARTPKYGDDPLDMDPECDHRVQTIATAADGHLCPVGSSFALYTFAEHLLHYKLLSEALRVISGLQVLSHMLAQRCGEVSCAPVLKENYLLDIKGRLDAETDRWVQPYTRALSPAQQRKAVGRSVAIVTFFHDDGHWRRKLNSSWAGQAPMEWYMENKRCYAARHGYDFIFEERGPLVDVMAERDGYGYSIHWNKLAVVRDALMTHDWVLYIDYDALFANFSKPLDEFMELMDRSATDLFVQNEQDLFQAGAFLLRSSRWAFEFLDSWEDFGLRRNFAGGTATVMWELRCFNCAVVHAILSAASGGGLAYCAEHDISKVLFRYLLDKTGYSYMGRRHKKFSGKVYFSDAFVDEPRGLLFEPNDMEQQKHFAESILYQPGDLILHWPYRDKDTEIMRAFANGGSGRDHGVDTCARWSQPNIDLKAVYYPSGGQNFPELFSPVQVLGLLERYKRSRKALVRIGLPDEMILVFHLTRSSYEEIHVLCHFPLDHYSIDKELLKDVGPGRLRRLPYTSIQSVSSADYDFMYIGFDTFPNTVVLNTDLGTGFVKLADGGILATPVAGECPAFPRTNFDFPPGWRQTRTNAIDSLGMDCRWLYLSKPFDVLHNEKGEGSSMKEALMHHIHTEKLSQEA